MVSEWRWFPARQTYVKVGDAWRAVNGCKCGVAHSDWAHEPKAERKAERSAVAAYLISWHMDVYYVAAASCDVVGGGGKTGELLQPALGRG